VISQEAEIDLTPAVDVTFQLLIFLHDHGVFQSAEGIRRAARKERRRGFQ
jgi:biopolymer transport protein ExbD